VEQEEREEREDQEKQGEPEKQTEQLDEEVMAEASVRCLGKVEDWLGLLFWFFGFGCLSIF
jgi:hypothetical protein